MASGVHLVSVVVLVMAVLAVAYGTTAPQLAVAEFAPSARRAVDPPPTTAGGPMASSARGGRRATTTVPPTTVAATATGDPGAAPTSRVARSRPCYGSPPRQIEDPMAPACMAAIYEGDNGGASSRGVSATEVRVAIPLPASTEKEMTALVDGLFEYVNRHFELYGRRLRPIYVPAGATNDPAASRALAAEMAAQDVFAAIPDPQQWAYGVQDAVFQELARQGVVTVTQGAGKLLSDRTTFDPLHPYLWSINPSVEDLYANIASFACAALVGRPARFAGQTELRTVPRTFGVIAHGIINAPRTRELVDGLRACDIDPKVVSSSRTASTALQTGLQALKAAGVTTVICACEGYNGVRDAYNAAAGPVGYGPEWILFPSDASSFEETMWQGMVTGTRSKPMWVMSSPRVQPLVARPWFGALQTTAAAVLLPQVYNHYYVVNLAEITYTSLLLLATGIQGAGPNLDPESFAAALLSTDFPNPGAGAAPYWQPSVGFGPGDHSFYDDYALAWWSQTAETMNPDSVSGRGSWCYVHAGARFRPGTYPTDADQLLFNNDQPCR